MPIDYGVWLSPRGRIPRGTYWLKYLLPLSVPIVLVAFLFPQTILLQLVWGLSFALWFVGATKRLHDHNGSGWILVAVFPGGIAAVLIAAEIGSRFSPRPFIDGDMVNMVGLMAYTVMFVGWLLLGVFLALAKGKKGPNKYGPDPLGAD